MKILALDTALDACSAAVLDGDRVLAARSEPMSRGHQERLALLVEALMAEAGIGFADLDRIGCTVGPGSFTGLRVGLAFAKGLAFSTGKPLVGVGGLQALAASVEAEGLVAAVVDARREQVYLQAFKGGVAATHPEALSVEDAARILINADSAGPAVLVGSGAALLAHAFPNAEQKPLLGPDPVVVARLAAASAAPEASPHPLYLRAPDAKLPA